MSEGVKTVRVERDRTTRVLSEAKKVWKPAKKLEVPEAPPGVDYRWVRYRQHDKEDEANVVERMRQYYEVVKPEELDYVTGVSTLEDGKFAGAVVKGDCILMKVPTEITEQRRAHYRAKNDRMVRAVDTERDRHSHPMMPIVDESTSSTTVGRGQNKFED